MTDSSTNVDTDYKNKFHGGQNGALMAVDSIDQSKTKADNQKTLRRLAQNREAARKSQLRTKAYVQQRENSLLKLEQLEQELQRACQQAGLLRQQMLQQMHRILSTRPAACAFLVISDYMSQNSEHSVHCG